MTNRRESIANAYRVRRQQARASRSVDLAWRSVILVVGATLLGLGVFFLIFPGPGWATMWLGAVILASEFAWARRLLVPLQRAANSLTSHAGPLRERRRAIVIVTLVAGVIVAFYVYWYGTSWQGLFTLHQSVRDALGW